MASNGCQQSRCSVVEPGPGCTPEGSEKRTLKDGWDEDEAPEESQRISSVCIGYGAAGKTGEAPSQKEHQEDLEKLAEEYAARNPRGELFVHIRITFEQP